MYRSDQLRKHYDNPDRPPWAPSRTSASWRREQEYGSHDKTFEVPSDSAMRVIDGSGNVARHANVETGDIWRMVQTKDEAIRDWVKLTVRRGPCPACRRSSGSTATARTTPN